MNLATFLSLMRHSWRGLILGLMVGVALGAVASLLQPIRYASTTEMFVSTSATDDASGLVQGVNYTQNQVQTYADVMTQPIVLDPVIEDLGLQVNAAALAQDLQANVSDGTVLLELTAYSDSAQGASDLANAVASQFATTVRDLESVEGTRSPVKVSVTSPASPSASPTSPQLARNLILGGLAGATIGLAVSVLRSITNTRIIDTKDLPQNTELPPLIGSIPYDRQAPKRPLLTQTDSQRPRAEAFRVLRTNLRFITPEKPPQIIVATSSIPHEGKSTTTANLALALAADGSKVLLIEADLRRPKLLEYMGLEGAVGLTTLLIGEAELEDVLQHHGLQWRVDVVGAGELPPNPSELLGSQRMAELLELTRSTYDYVVLDAPPLLPVTDAAVLARQADGTILIVGSGVVRRAQLLAAHDALLNVGAHILGLVMNKVPTPSRSAGGHYYQAYARDVGSEADADDSAENDVYGRYASNTSTPSITP